MEFIMWKRKRLQKGIDDVEEEGAAGGIYDVRKKEPLLELIMRRRKSLLMGQIIWDRKSY